MAWFNSHFFSETLGLSVTAEVLVPQDAPGQIGMPGRAVGRVHPVLYLLHGLSDDHTAWVRRTSIERYAAERGLAVVMPAVGRSFYQDLVSGPRYWTYLSEELPQLIRQFFPISAEPAATFAAGLSMGGYGAMRLALAHPGRFAAAASLSGALDMRRLSRTAGRPGSRLAAAEALAMFGPELSPAGTPSDLWHLAEAAGASGQPLPALYVGCGTEDPLMEENRAFRDQLETCGVAHTYSESAGTHEWSYWDREIQHVLAWLPIP